MKAIHSGKWNLLSSASKVELFDSNFIGAECNGQIEMEI